MTNSFCVFSDSFFAHLFPDILAKHNMKETSSKHNIWDPFNILPNLRINVLIKEKNIQFQGEKAILTLIPIICTGMYNNGDINSPRSYFLMRAYKKTKIPPKCTTIDSLRQINK